MNNYNDKLKSGDKCGKVAQAIYKEYCDKFGWDISKAGWFAKQKVLYARDVTREGYSVWFLANSNWSNSKGGIWKNKICDGITYIKESWLNVGKGFMDDTDTRVVFAKNLRGEYVFLGIYVCDEIDRASLIKTYKLIDGEYPSEI